MSVLGLVRLHADDDVLVAMSDAVSATGVAIAAGHKAAARDLAPGEPIRKVGLVIGWASTAICAGDHVHVHNVSAHGELPPSTAVAAAPPPAPGRTFMGIPRADGRFATRNHVLVITTVNCSATVARAVASEGNRLLHDTPGIDGVTALVHASGCGLPGTGPQIDRLRAVLAGYARNVNTAGVVVLGLGCEVNQVDSFLAATGLEPGPTLETVVIQDVGGTRAAIDAGLAAIARITPRVATTERVEVSARHLTLGLQCGGSDGFSALTANPVLGRASDLLIADGATIMLSETPELSGTEEVLVARAENDAVRAELRRLFQWWRDYTAAGGAEMDSNPSPGNQAGGITNIVEKSVGAAAKGGSTAVRAVIGYAQQPTTNGLVVMDTPGYDPASVTGQVAGGANLICFTTGRGSCFGSKPAPTVKLSTTSELFRRMAGDLDLDCGGVITGEYSVAHRGEQLADLLCAVAGGRRTASEVLGYGDEEFTPWLDGVTM
jgi:altronate hydrolase